MIMGLQVFGSGDNFYGCTCYEFWYIFLMYIIGIRKDPKSEIISINCNFW